MAAKGPSPQTKIHDETTACDAKPNTRLPLAALSGEHTLTIAWTGASDVGLQGQDGRLLRVGAPCLTCREQGKESYDVVWLTSLPMLGICSRVNSKTNAPVQALEANPTDATSSACTPSLKCPEEREKKELRPWHGA
jgi:hypothetical protein